MHPPRPNPLFHSVCLWASLSLSGAAWGAVDNPLPELADSGMKQADVTRAYVSQQFVRLVNGLDRFFGDDRNFQENNRSVFQLDLDEQMTAGGQRESTLSGRIKLHLPSTEHRLHLLLESDPEQNTAGPGAAQNQTQRIGPFRAPGEYGLALRLEESEEQIWHTSTDIGVKLHAPLEPFARVRASLVVPMGEWRMKPAQSLYWFSQSGLGETTQLDFERPLAPQTLFRATSSVTWLHLPQRFDLQQDFTVFHTLDEKRAVQYQISLIGVSRPQSRLDDAVMSVLYRRQLNRRWLFFEFNPQLHFRHSQSYDMDPLLWLRLQMLFDEE
ncbi:MAG: hypothetical protein ABII81_02950 [Pseudomonadota bacterium]